MELEHNEITGQIIAAALEVYRVLGYMTSHGMCSEKSFRCSSSSATIVIIPLHHPGCGRCCMAGASLASLATGWSFSVITTTSPGLSRWINSVSLACAS